MTLKGTVYIYPQGGDIPVVTMLRFVKEHEVDGEESFRQVVRQEYPNPGVIVEFGPIGRPWPIRNV